MKKDANNNDVFAGGVVETLDFQVASTPEMMAVLSDRLYKFKERAPVRELSTNAWDAHISAKNLGKAPDIHLPSDEEPYYYIRDYGTGLDYEAMKAVYRRYGVSTKNDSNDFNGQMGLGSKSPFAVVRSFTTTSYHNGMKHTFINSKGSDGKPQLNLMESVPTDEPNGLEVRFDVEPKNFEKFHKEVENVLPWFPTRFDIVHSKRAVNIKNPYGYYDEIKGKNWKIRKVGYGSNSKPVAIMGWVEYPIDKKIFVEEDKSQSEIDGVQNDWYQHYEEFSHIDFTSLLSAGLELSFNIGEVNFTPSREELLYNEKTIYAIRKRLKEIWETVNADLKKKFADCETLWDARVLYQELVSTGSQLIKQLLRMGSPEWKGEKVDCYIHERDFANAGDFSLLEFSRRRNGKIRRERTKSIRATKDVRFYECDMKTGSYAAVGRELEASYLVVDEAPIVPYLFKFETEEQRELVKTILGVEDFIKTSSLPKPVRAGKRKSGRIIDKLFTLDMECHLYGGRKSRFWKAAKVDFWDGGLFVEINAYNAVSADGDRLTPTDLRLLLERAASLGIRIPVIHGVKSSVIKRYRKSNKWTDLFDLMTKRIGQFVKKKGLDKKDGYIKAIDGLGNYKNLPRFSEVSDVKLDENSYCYQFIEKVKEISGRFNTDATEELTRKVRCLSEFGYTLVPKECELTKMASKLHEKYEALNLLCHDQSQYSRHIRTDRTSTEARAKVAFNYVNLVESCNKGN